MKKRIKTSVLLLTVFLSVLVMSYVVYAEVPDDYVPNYNYANSATARISITGNTAKLTGTLTGKASVTKIKCTLTLQKKVSGVWSNVKSWTKEVNARSITFSKSQDISHGIYRTKANFKVYVGADYESINVYSSQITY